MTEVRKKSSFNAHLTTDHAKPLTRYLILAAAVMISMCTGATYSWSVFATPLKQWTGLGQGSVQLPFSLFYIAFPATLIFAGPLFSRLGPRRCVASGGLIFGGGWILASFGAADFRLTLLGIGLLGGIGVGLTYVAPIATGMQWFPERKGFITGVAVAGFGGGAAIVAQAAGALMKGGGPPFPVFRIFGILFMIIIVAAGMVLRLPARSREAPHGPPLGRSLVALREGAFWALYGAMAAGLVGGFAINANLKQLYQGPSVQAGITAVSLFALANAAGRLGWGAFFDRAHSATAVRLNLALQGATLIAAPWLIRTAAGLMALALLAGFQYGGVLVIYASSTARRWGPERLGPIYGWLFSANIIASFAPAVVGRVFDRTGSFTPALMAIGAVLVIAATTFRLKE